MLTNPPSKEATQKLITAIIAEWNEHSVDSQRLEDFISERLSEVCTTISQTKAAHAELGRLEMEYLQMKRDAEENLRLVQKQCKHWLITYYPDSSGNNDSSHVCDICDATVKRKRRT